MSYNTGILLQFYFHFSPDIIPVIIQIWSRFETFDFCFFLVFVTNEIIICRYTIIKIKITVFCSKVFTLNKIIVLYGNLLLLK